MFLRNVGTPARELDITYKTSYKLYCILRIVTVLKALFLKKYNLQQSIKCHCVWHSYNGCIENPQTRYWCVSEGTCGRISRQLGRREYVGNKHPTPRCR